MTISLHKNAIKALLVLSYISLSMVIVVGLSAVLTYLNTGADRNIMLHNKIHETIHYQPTIQWNTEHNLGRAMDDFTLQKIEKDYLNAWYVKHIAFYKNTSKGLKDYYTKSALQTLLSGIEFNQQNNIHINATTLNHHTTLDFFSEDGQLVVLTDHNVKEFKQVYTDNQIQTNTTEINTYKVLLLLEDAFWRIRHIVKVQPTQQHISQHPTVKIDYNIKGINYYPQNTPWDMFGDEFDPKIIAKDFDIIRQAGLNTIRIFIQYEDFGKSEVLSDKIKKLQTVLNLADQKQLKVIPTLFDFYGNYDVLDWTLNNKHAKTIVKACKDYSALLAWDIKNEPNLDFESRGKERVLAWLAQMIAVVKNEDSVHPVTIGWSNVKSATLLADKVDLVTFHYYEDLNSLATKHQQLQKEIPHKKIILGEFGLSSYRGLWNPLGHSETDQAEYHKKFQEIAQQNGIDFLSWTLYDFTEVPSSVVGKLPWRKHQQKHFGFIDKNKKQKKSFQYIAKP